MVFPSFGRLTIGRPGRFRVITAVSGNPGTMNAVATKDGTIWLSNANGLFAFPSRLRTEFWAEREGLDGNTWSILRTSGKTYALAGQTIRVLDTRPAPLDFASRGGQSLIGRLVVGPAGRHHRGGYCFIRGTPGVANK